MAIPFTPLTFSNNMPSGYALDENFADIKSALQSALSREHSNDNEMKVDLDMNANRILNLPTPKDQSEAARLADVQAALSGGGANLITFTPYDFITADNVQGAIEQTADRATATKDTVEDATFGLNERVLYVDTISDLQALPTSELINKQQAMVSEYVAGSASGGGVFYWDDSSTTPDNGGTVFEVPEVSVGRWIRGPGVFVTPEEFGIFGSGDETDDVQRLITYATSEDKPILWGVADVLCNRVQFSGGLRIEFVGNGSAKTTEVSERDVAGNITYAGASFISTDATSVHIKGAVHSGGAPSDGAYLVFVESDALEKFEVVDCEYIDSGHYCEAGLGCVAKEYRNKFRSSVNSNSVTAREGVMPFSSISVGGEDWAAEDEPRTRTGKLWSRDNDFKVWCRDGSNRDIAKYTGLCEAPQIEGNHYHNLNILSEAEVDTYTAAYRAKINNDHVNCSIKVQTILGALSDRTSSAPVSHFTRIGGSYKFEDGSSNIFGILARGGYFLVNDYVIDAKKTTANVSFNAVHVRSSDTDFYLSDGTSSAISYVVGQGLIDIRCDNYNGKSITPFNDFTSRVNYLYNGVVVLGGNGLLVNGANLGAFANVNVYEADDYSFPAVTGGKLYSSGLRMYNANGDIKPGSYALPTSQNNDMEVIATSVSDPSGVIDLETTGDNVRFSGTGTVDGFSGQRGRRLVVSHDGSGTISLIDSSASLILKDRTNTAMTESWHVVEFQKFTSTGPWVQVGGNI